MARRYRKLDLAVRDAGVHIAATGWTRRRSCNIFEPFLHHQTWMKKHMTHGWPGQLVYGQVLIQSGWMRLRIEQYSLRDKQQFQILSSRALRKAVDNVPEIVHSTSRVTAGNEIRLECRR